MEEKGNIKGFGACKGFTLIELLVVVLIIGILAAVALPQYNKAIEHSRATQAINMLSSIAKAYQSYYLANGTQATKFEELDLDIPFNGDIKFVNLDDEDNVGDTKSNKDWSFQIETNINGAILYAVRISGKYKGAGFMFMAANYNGSAVQQKQLQCFERTRGANFTFNNKLPNGAYCEQIIKATPYLDGAYGRYYKLP